MIEILWQVIGLAFFVLGYFLVTDASRHSRTFAVKYDDLEECTLGSECIVSIEVEESLNNPLVYYKLTNFYQNNYEYTRSYDRIQLLGDYRLRERKIDAGLTTCERLEKLKDGTALNPCGLIANSLFNDEITLFSPGLKMKTTGIALSGDENKFYQPGHGTICPECDAFKFAEATDAGVYGVSGCLNSTCSNDICDHWLGPEKTSCKGYYCAKPDVFNCKAGQSYVFWYPEDEDQQYLYEAFPEVVSPLEGVNNEHFQVWFRVAAFPNVLKLYGKINGTVRANSSLAFKIVNNFDTSSSGGAKYLVVSSASWFGGNTRFLGSAFMATGILCFAGAFTFLSRGVLPCFRREYGDIGVIERPPAAERLDAVAAS